MQHTDRQWSGVNVLNGKSLISFPPLPQISSGAICNGVHFLFSTLCSFFSLYGTKLMRGMWGSEVYILLVLGAGGRIHYSLCSVQLSQLQFLLQGLGGC